MSSRIRHSGSSARVSTSSTRGRQSAPSFEQTVSSKAKQAGSAAALDGVLGGVSAAVRSYGDLSSGRIDGVEYAGRVAVGAVRAGGEAAAKRAAVMALKEGAKVAARRAGTETIKRVAGSNAVTAVAFGVVDQGADTIRLIAGTIDGAEYGKRSMSNVGGTGGAIGGAALGAAIGSAVPGVGTAVGAIVGGIIGSLSGSFGARGLAELIWVD